MHQDTTRFIFNQLYSGVDGYRLSAAGKTRLAAEDKSLTYGEVSLESMVTILATVEPSAGHIFYDLGAGTGKAVLLAALLPPFWEVRGIEILDELYEKSQEVLERFETGVRPHLPEEQIGKIHFIKGDILHHDFSDGDVVLAQTTCFPENLMLDLEEKLEKLKPGSKVITLSQSLRSPLFEMTHSGKCRMGWGEATVFVHRKLDEGN